MREGERWRSTCWCPGRGSAIGGGMTSRPGFGTAVTEVHALTLSGLGGEDDAASVHLDRQAADVVEAIEQNDAGT